MIPIFALTVLIAIYSFGEFVAEKTKARLSMTLVITITLLLGFWTILPKSVFADSSIIPLAMVVIGILITSLGTRINFKQLKEQIRTVGVALIGMILSVVGIMIVGEFFINRSYAFAGAPIFAGGNAATLVMMDALKAKGLDEALTFCILLLVTQSFVGIPVSSFLLRREARSLIEDEEKFSAALEIKLNEDTKNKKLINLPKEFQKPAVQMLKLGITATIASVLSTYTGGRIHYFVICLLLGILFYELGFLEEDSLSKTDSSTLILFLTTLVISSNLTEVTPETVIEMSIPLLVVLGIGVLGAIVFGTLLSKIFRIESGLAIALILTCTFGFPTTFFMSHEVAQAVGETDEQKTAIINYIEPKMLSAGFVTVTIFSIFIAGIVAGIL